MPGAAEKSDLKKQVSLPIISSLFCKVVGTNHNLFG
jgi:hypothetical protein